MLFALMPLLSFNYNMKNVEMPLTHPIAWILSNCARHRFGIFEFYKYQNHTHYTMQ